MQPIAAQQKRRGVIVRHRIAQIDAVLERRSPFRLFRRRRQACTPPPSRVHPDFATPVQTTAWRKRSTAAPRSDKTAFSSDSSHLSVPDNGKQAPVLSETCLRERFPVYADRVLPFSPPTLPFPYAKSHQSHRAKKKKRVFNAPGAENRVFLSISRQHESRKIAPDSASRRRTGFRLAAAVHRRCRTDLTVPCAAVVIPDEPC